MIKDRILEFALRINPEGDLAIRSSLPAVVLFSLGIGCALKIQEKSKIETALYKGAPFVLALTGLLGGVAVGFDNTAPLLALSAGAPMSVAITLREYDTRQIERKSDKSHLKH